MTGVLRTLIAATIAEYVERVLQLRREWETAYTDFDLWFRGVGSQLFKLLPGAYWRPRCEEDSIFLSFRNAVPSYVHRNPIDDWEWYYLMQHYGLPTRLLDWSESALAALYFAVSSAEPGQQPAVWVLIPDQLNKLTHKHSGAYVFTPEGNQDMKHWLPPICGRGKPITAVLGSADFADNRLPVAIFPRRANPRIVAQRGTFTIHGVEEIPIEDLLLKSMPSGTAPIARIELAFADLARTMEELRTLGLDHTALFPEPASVALDLKRTYGIV